MEELLGINTSGEDKGVVMMRSKRQIKRESKQEKYEQNKKEWKLKEKLKKKQKKKMLKQKKEDKNEETKQPIELNFSQEYAPKKKFHREEYIAGVEKGMPVIIDCSFQNLLTEKELQSLTIQLSYCHNINKKYEKPTKLSVTNFRGKLKEKMEKHGALSWGINLLENHYLDYYGKEDLIYLSGDATETLSEIDPKQIHFCPKFLGKYIQSVDWLIIIDINVPHLIKHQKRVFLLNLLKFQIGIAVKRFPIEQFLKLKASTILAVNHVFEVVVRVYNGESFGDALKHSIPKRKIDEECQKEPQQHKEDKQQLQLC